MSYECEECGESFNTLSRLRLHDCSSESTTDFGDPPADEETLPVEEEYSELIGDLPDLVAEAQDGSLPALYQAIAEYESVLADAPTSEEPGTTGADHEIRFGYYEPLADALDTTAQANGWDVLVEFVDAYAPDEQDGLPEVTHVVANAVGRSIVRTRLRESVGAIPASALEYLDAIPDYADEFDLPFEESYTYGWGIGHPDHSVSDTLLAMAQTDYKWTRITLNTAFYADQYAAVDTLERLVIDIEFTGTIQRMSFETDPLRYYFGATADLKLDGVGPHVPPYWVWEDEIDYSFELDPEVRQRIRDLVHETGVVDDLPDDWTLQDLEPGPLSDLQEELLSSQDE